MSRGRSMFAILMPTLECNLACTYCFEEHTKGRWDRDTTARIIDQVVDLAVAEGAGELTFHWQGGEVLLMGLEYWKRTCAMAADAAAAAGLSSVQRMQTNLLSYTGHWAPLIHDVFGSEIGTSFEPGTARRFPNGDGTRFEQRWLEAFRRANDDGLSVGVISVLSQDAIRVGADAWLRQVVDELGVRRLRFNLPFDQSKDTPMGYWLDPVEAGHFLADAYRWWVANGRDADMYFKPFRFLEDLLTVGRTEETGLCIFNPNCVDISLAVGPDGSVVLCDNFVSTDVWEPFGNAFEAPLTRIYRGAQREKIRRRVQRRLEPKCGQCRYITVCHGGCPVRSHLWVDGGYHYCDTYKILCGAIEDLNGVRGRYAGLR